jgi:two-component system response regulator CpxR
MAILSIFSASFCRGEEISDILASKLNWNRIDGPLTAAVAQRFGASPKNILRAMEGPAFVFNKFTRRREKLVAQIRVVLAEMLDDRQILFGYPAHLIPAGIGHVLRVCLLADPDWRVQNMQAGDHAEALKKLRAEDLKSAQWTHLVHRASPWDRTLYDLVIMVNDCGIDGAVQLILENANKPVLGYSEAARGSLGNFRVAAGAELALADAGLYHEVSCRDGMVTVTVNEYVMMMERLEADIRKVLRPLKDIRQVNVVTGPNYRPPSVFSNMDFDLPEKVLLVDDEKDFVTTLSERLEMRDVEPAVVYSGEEALTLLEEETPDVMVLDLRMPGIDGIEVLRKVKSDHPSVAVIILTGHGSEKDRELCMSLGAFAYLEKPVDIDELSETMKRAKEFIRSQHPKN